MVLESLPRSLWVIAVGNNPSNKLVFTSRERARNYMRRLKANGFEDVHMYGAAVGEPTLTY